MNALTIVELLAFAAKANPHRAIYTFVTEATGRHESLTMGDLYGRAGAVAKALRKVAIPGDRILIVCNHGAEPVIGFIACLLGGYVAVPVPPPQKKGVDQRLHSIAKDAGATIVLGALERQLPEFGCNLRAFLPNDDLFKKTVHADLLLESSTDPDSLALLQYTSGSTALPKGVMVSHRNLMSNAAHMHKVFGLSRSDSAVLWLPLYHDMGLMGGVIQPIYSGYPTIFLSPASFMNRPLQWLETISNFRATVSGGPNFAYDLCARLKPETEHTLDLSSWRVAFNGSEPIRSETLQSFAETFIPYGFRAEAFRPCYGLAEATLLVSCVSPGQVSSLAVNGELLQEGRVQTTRAETSRTKNLVAIGTSAEHKLAVVDPERGLLCGEDHVGEIWVSGPAVARGYWNRKAETDSSFRAKLPSEASDNYLRTGDLGFIHGGQLFIAGRLKDLIIIRGRNYYPQDIEAGVESCHSMLRRGCTAAFSVEADNQEQLVIVQELTRRGMKGDFSEIIRAIRQQIMEEHGLSVYAILLIRTATLPKTSSGKVRRRACRDAFLADTLNVVAMERTGPIAVAPGRESEATEAGVCRTVGEKLLEQAGISMAGLDPELPISSLGMDSLKMLQFKMLVEDVAGNTVTMSQMMGQMTVGDFRKWVAQAGKNDTALGAPQERSHPSRYPLSVGQKALWFLQELEPDNTALTIARLLRIEGPLDRNRLRAAFDAIGARHPGLRIRVMSINGTPHQLEDGQGLLMEEHDARGWSEPELARHIAGKAKEPFVLADGPVSRIHLYLLSPTDARLLLCVHHIALDLWSLALIVQELVLLYERMATGDPCGLPAPSAHYSQFVEWQESLLAGEKGKNLWEFWSKKLSSLPPPLVLGAAQANGRPGESRIHRFVISNKTVDQLRTIARGNQMTLNALLLAAFEALLYRYSRQNEFLLGLLTVGRDSSQWKDVLGYFVNPVVLRPSITGNASFARHMTECRAELLDAIDHSGFPFATLVARLHSARNAGPLIQIMCMLQPAHAADGINIGPLALGSAGSCFRMESLDVTSLESNFGGTQFDLVFAAAEAGTAVHAAFEFQTARFEQDFIAGLAEDYCTLLDGIAVDSHTCIDNLPLLSERRAHQALYAWNMTEKSEVPETCIHHEIERHAAHTPAHVALIFERSQLTYSELNVRANQLAHYLKTIGVDGEARVGVFLQRSIEMIVALLGVLKAGGAYVPLDPAYPAERIKSILSSTPVQAVLTTEALRDFLPSNMPVNMVMLDHEAGAISAQPVDNPAAPVSGDNLVYVMHTSGSTGSPKGVMVSHRNVLNFFCGMDDKIGCGPGDTLLAVTSIAFDISVLELLWTLSRGCRVVLVREPSVQSLPRKRLKSPVQGLRFSLFYFATAASRPDEHSYRLLLEGAKLADQYGFEAVWTPERHFHPFGGLYPNPSVTSAALATITHRVRLRAGSVVLPLQSPIRIAEEWALVDNLSNGRVDIAFASGWHADDFVFFPQNYHRRREVMLAGMNIVRQLWRGETIRAASGSGAEIEIATYPRPVQRELPVWLTSGGSPETFALAATQNINVLTHLLGQDIRGVAERIKIYRDTLSHAGKDPSARNVTLMLHTYLDESEDKVRSKALEPFKQYLDSSIGLLSALVRSLGLDLDITKMTGKDKDDLLLFAAERYLNTSGLFGDEKSCLEMLDAMASIGVNEIACLVDFGIDADSAMASIRRLDNLQRRLRQECDAVADDSLAGQISRHQVTMLQCTPSFLRMTLGNAAMKEALGTLRVLMLGGEQVPVSVVKEAAQCGVPAIFNMYGPTETTIWSAVSRLDPSEDQVFIGGPIANTRIYLLDPALNPVPPGVSAEIFLGGAGLARGYSGVPDLTAERFLPDPFSKVPGARLYKTGDIGRLRNDGRIEVLGRTDQQVKIRGHRIELGDIESVLNGSPGVELGVAAKFSTGPEEEQLVAFLVPSSAAGVDIRAVREFLRGRLPEHMVPNAFHVVQELPLTANGKVDRKALNLPMPELAAISANIVAPRTQLETRILSTWKEVLRRENISIDDKFFDVGGHSLSMVQVHHKVQQLVAREFPLIALLHHPTVRSLASYLDGEVRQVDPEASDRLVRQKSAYRAERERIAAARHRN